VVLTGTRATVESVLTSEDAGRSVAPSFFDAEEDRGSNPQPPTDDGLGAAPLLLPELQAQAGESQDE
jgi:hypothetical protein